MRLLGVLLGVGLALGLTVFVADRVDQQGGASAKNVGVTVLPGGIVVPPTDGAAVASGSAVDAARTVACAGAAQALRAAEDQYQAVNGKYADLPGLVAAGVIRAPGESLYVIASDDGFATFRLVGRQGCP